MGSTASYYWKRDHNAEPAMIVSSQEIGWFIFNTNKDIDFTDPIIVIL